MSGRLIGTGLSSRLLVLTAAFVMLAEVLIYVPSIARFRVAWLEERLEAANLAALALKATPDYMVSDELSEELLAGAGVRGIVLKRPESRSLMLSERMPPAVDASYDLREATPISKILAAFSTLRHGDRAMRVTEGFRDGSPGHIEIVLDEAPLRRALVKYSINILTLSLVISLIAAGLVYLALHILIVRPMRDLTRSIAAFRTAPEDDSSVLRPAARRDEIGEAERELAAMQEELRQALRQKTRLAALGAAVAKINHDLRNMLATAHLLSDRLAASGDPEVRKITPTLIATVDRAIELCAQTLEYGRAEEPAPRRTRFDLAALVEDVALHVGIPADGRIAWRNMVAPGIEAEADRDQLFRVLLNLGRNAVQALERGGAIRVTAERCDGRLAIELGDDGPGLPGKARQTLFKAFSGSAKAGGAGLGLAIAWELARAHGGELTLKKSDGEGTIFRLELPQNGPH
jgi:signal transduction histidine kinase